MSTFFFEHSSFLLVETHSLIFSLPLTFAVALVLLNYIVRTKSPRPGQPLPSTSQLHLLKDEEIMVQSNKKHFIDTELSQQQPKDIQSTALVPNDEETYNIQVQTSSPKVVHTGRHRPSPVKKTPVYLKSATAFKEHQLKKSKASSR